MSIYSVDKLMTEARRLAAEYRRTTGKSLAISNEIALFDAARLLKLEVPEVAVGGYDAVGRQGCREGQRIQVKARVLFDERKPGQRIGQLKLDKEWDRIMLVLMDENYESSEIYEATRDEIIGALEGRSSQRSRRGAMSIARFRHVSRLVWTREEGEITGEPWEN